MEKAYDAIHCLIIKKNINVLFVPNVFNIYVSLSIDQMEQIKQCKMMIANKGEKIGTIIC